MGHSGIVCSAVTSQLEGQEFDFRRESLWVLGVCSLLHISTLGGVAKGPFCVEFACSLRVS